MSLLVGAVPTVLGSESPRKKQTIEEKVNIFLNGPKAHIPAKQEKFLQSLKLQSHHPEWQKCLVILQSTEQGCNSPRSKAWQILRLLPDNK